MNESTFQILQIFASRTSLNLSQLEAILNRDLLEIAAPVAYLREQGYLKKYHILWRQEWVVQAILFHLRICFS